MRHQFTRAQQQRGGQTTAGLPGGVCPRCHKSFSTHPKLAGHLGLHSFADKYTGGNMRQAAHKLNLIGIAATDPFPGNGAFATAHRAAAEVQSMKEQQPCAIK